MANPNNAIGTNAAFGGRTSPNAFNDVLGAFSGRGILSGWQISPNSGMTVSLGGDGENRDVALAEDNAGNKTTINNIPGTPISLTIEAAPATNSRIDAVVAYVNNPPQGVSTETDNFSAVAILDVQGTSASSPVAPDDSAIRTAITADGASGATAYYVVLGYVTIASGTTDITANIITQAPRVTLRNGIAEIANGAVTADKIANGAVTADKLKWDTLGFVFDSQPDETSGTTLNSVTITTPGTYLVIGWWNIFGRENYYNIFPSYQLAAGETAFATAQYKVGSDGSHSWNQQPGMIMGIATVAANTTIRLTQSLTVPTRNRCLVALRVG